MKVSQLCLLFLVSRTEVPQNRHKLQFISVFERNWIWALFEWIIMVFSFWKWNDTDGGDWEVLNLWGKFRIFCSGVTSQNVTELMMELSCWVKCSLCSLAAVWIDTALVGIERQNRGGLVPSQTLQQTNIKEQHKWWNILSPPFRLSFDDFCTHDLVIQPFSVQNKLWNFNSCFEKFNIV